MAEESGGVIEWLESQFDQEQASREEIKRKYRSFDDQVRDMYDPVVVHTE